MALTVRTDQEVEHALTVLTETEGASRQEVIRRAVLERYERTGHRARVQESSSRLIERWADVLQRLHVAQGTAAVEEIADRLQAVPTPGVEAPRPRPPVR